MTRSAEESSSMLLLQQIVEAVTIYNSEVSEMEIFGYKMNKGLEGTPNIR